MLVSFYFAVPAAPYGVGDELLLHVEAGSEAGCVVAGGQEFGAVEDQIAFTGSFGRGAPPLNNFPNSSSTPS